ncbi:MAG TPA: alpha-amylase family glycosyl hydrolase [Acidimicrobiales bacterium]|nr:alpha-amylase family glycosyl hydrolase [Acidimicrobiales bacterium]
MTWWQEAVVYQIYPRSFCDSNGDGVGDLNGVRSRLAYLASLGVDALWLSPIYPSPMRDFGYDVANYVDVDQVFGSLAVFDELVQEAHALGIRVLLDWVPNHTSSDHPWFEASRASRGSPFRDWYLWRDADPNGSLPNNWVRAWSEESTWTWDEATGQYYLHLFLPSQPDLNWANVDVRRAMHETVRFWLDRGVDGFRMDVIHALGKDLAVDDPEDLRLLSHVPLNDVTVTHDYLREIRSVLDEYEGERVSVGEVYLLDPARVATYYGAGDELHLSFNFASIYTPWRARAWLELIEHTENVHKIANAWPTWVLSNHDNPRAATRLGGEDRVRAAMVLLLTLRGTPFLYAGEELGLKDADVPQDRVVDPGGRDGCRSPLPWTRAAHHGWGVEPWLPFADRSTELSVESQQQEATSMLNFTRRLLEVRRSSEALRRGELVNLHLEGDVLIYDRVAGERRVRVFINFAKHLSRITEPEGSLLISSMARHTVNELGANEAVIYEFGAVLPVDP